MSFCRKLWTVWFLIYLLVVSIYLAVSTIKDYILFKTNMLDEAYGGHWSPSSVHVVLGCLNVCLGLLPVIILVTLLPQQNLANDGLLLGRDVDPFNLSVDPRGCAHILPNSTKHSHLCCRSPSLSLLLLELPPITYILHVISAMCFLIPKTFMEAHRIRNGVLKASGIWHSDLDFIFDPDRQHHDFGPFLPEITPVSVAYFNLGFGLALLSLQYSRVLWYVSRKFTILFSFLMMLWTIHVLVEFSTISVMIKISVNDEMVTHNLQILLNPFTILFLSLAGNTILLFSFTTIFHYGLLQYADTMFHKSRRTRRQVLTASPQMICSNHLDIPAAFSPCVSENNYSDSSLEPVFSKTHVPHVVAVVCILVSSSLKSVNVYESFIRLYTTTSDSLVLTNLLLSGLFAIVWLITWFAFALRRTWNFKIKTDLKCNSETLFMSGNSGPNHSGTMQLHQINNSLLRNTKSSDITLSKQDMLAMNRNIGLDGCSDDTDMSSKMSSNNYVFLQSMRNGQMGLLDANGQPPMLRNPMYLTYSVNSQGLPNHNMIYTNDDSLNNRSIQLEDPLGSEHSYNSNPSRNVGFENMPPILPTFDENRYKTLNPNSVAMEKLIPRYLRNGSLDYNNMVHFSMPNNDFCSPTVTTPTMSYTFDNRYKPSFPSNQMRPDIQKYSTIQTTTKCSGDSSELYMHNVDDDGQRRPFYNGDSVAKSNFDPRRAVKSPVMFPTLEESVMDNLPTESECLLPKYNKLTGVVEGANCETQISESNNNNECNTVNDRMCSQV